MSARPVTNVAAAGAGGLIAAIARRAALLLAALLWLAAAPLTPAMAQQGSVAVVRDAEIEALLRDYAAPVLKAAGLDDSGIEIILVNDPSFNAFVTGRRIFIFTGALMMTETPNEIIGVIAHEAGHLAGGHQFRLRERLDGARTMAIVANLLGVGAVVAGAAAGDGDVARAGTGIAAGGNEAARRSILSYQRGEESAADASAVQYLNRTKQSARGMLTTFERLADAMQFTTGVNPYQLSHPLPRDRIEALKTEAMASPYFDAKDSKALQERHDLMRAKIAAYTAGQGALARMFKDRSSLAARYGDAIISNLRGNPGDGIKKAQALIKSKPKYPYFHEVLGDALLRANKPKEAAAAYGTAIKLETARSSLIRMSQGRALLAAGDADAAIKALETGIQYDKRSADGWGALAQAYGAKGLVGDAELATAEMHFNRGAFRDAKKFAIRAQQRLKQGSPEWIRAQDIISFKR
jgi:predicted Zn-dependent protease